MRPAIGGLIGMLQRDDARSEWLAGCFIAIGMYASTDLQECRFAC